MAKTIKREGEQAARGERMPEVAGWRLFVSTKGRDLVFFARLLHTFKIGNKRIAIFRLPK